MSKISVVKSISATPAQVWAVIGNPFELDQWHPAIASLTAGDATRTLTLPDGAVIHEKILARDEGAMSYDYAITESPLPIKDYRSKLSVQATDGGAVVTWEGSFEPLAAQAEMEATVQGLYEAGLSALEASFA